MARLASIGTIETGHGQVCALRLEHSTARVVGSWAESHRMRGLCRLFKYAKYPNCFVYQDGDIPRCPKAVIETGGVR